MNYTSFQNFILFEMKMHLVSEKSIFDYFNIENWAVHTKKIKIWRGKN